MVRAEEMQVEQHELDKNAYVGVDEMYQNAANHTEYPMNTEHEQAAIDASRAEYVEYAEDDVEVTDVEIEDDEELDGNVGDEIKPPGADNGFVQTEPAEPIKTAPLL